MKDDHLVALLAAIIALILPSFGWAQTTSSTGGTLMVQPADEAALGQVAPTPTARQALEPRQAPGPMIAPGAQFEPGYYRGVVPGASHIPPRAYRLKRTRRNFVTWPGFEMTEGGSRIFVQSTRPLTYTRESATNQIVIVLRSSRIHLRNNFNPLVTEHFNTPVARAYLRHRGRDTLLILEMKVNASASIHQQSEGEYHFLFVEFPGGTYPIPEGVRQPRYRNDESTDSGRITVSDKSKK